MPTVNETIKALQDIVALNPKFGELPCVYSHDDKGNEYQRVINEPCLCQIKDLNKESYRYLDLVAFINDGSDCNAVIIN